MRKKLRISGLMLAGLLTAGLVKAQLSTNPDKFLGNITTRGQVNGGGEFANWWNQITPENESKWGSVEGTRGRFNWGGADAGYNYAKSHNFPFKFHAIIWGAQHPGWFNADLSVEERRKALINWMDAMKKHYNTIDMIDVANECIAGHQGDTYLFEEPFGGKGVSGFDYLVNAFEMAHERWPDAILIYNDFNTFRWQKNEFIELCTALRDAGAPIDAYGCQSHDLTDMEFDEFKRAMDEIQSKLKMPMVSSEYDIGTNDDDLQLRRYSAQIPYMWEADYCAGITLWGFIYGATWTTDGNSGIIRNGKDRPAMTWLKEYMKTEKAKTAKSPFPGMKKEHDLYIKPAAPKVYLAEPTTIDLRAKLRTKTIDRIEFYANNQLYETLIEAPWVVNYTPGKLGKIPLRAVMVATDGTRYERLGSLNVVSARKAYKSNPIPGIIEAENFDSGLEGDAYHDSDYSNTGGKTNYRSDGGGVDMVAAGSGVAVSETVTGEWLEYTVRVKRDGYCSYELTASAGVEGSAISFSMKTDEGYVPVTGTITIPCTKKNSWSTYQTFYGRIPYEFKEGQYIMRMNIEKGGCNIDRIRFNACDYNDEIELNLDTHGDVAYENEEMTISATVQSEAEIKNVAFYANGVSVKTVLSEPYQATYVPKSVGTHEIMAYATDTDGKVSKMITKSVVVRKKRIPFKGLIEIPGELEAENFDKMGEGYSFHDSDNVDEGKSRYRSDNEGVDIVKITDGYAVAHTAVGEWMDYSVDVKLSGEYSFTYIFSTDGTDNGQFQIFLVDDETGTETAVSSKLASTATKGAYKERTGKLNKKLARGQQVLRIKILKPLNFDKLIFTCTAPDENQEDAIQQVEAQRIDTYEVYSTTGARLGNFRATSSENLSEKALGVTRQRGTYILKNTATGESKTVILTD